jgi:hypothetical protein
MLGNLFIEIWNVNLLVHLFIKLMIKCIWTSIQNFILQGTSINSYLDNKTDINEQN